MSINLQLLFNVYCILLVFCCVHYSYLNLCVILITASIICYLLTEMYVIISEQEVTLVNIQFKLMTSLIW